MTTQLITQSATLILVDNFPERQLNDSSAESGKTSRANDPLYHFNREILSPWIRFAFANIPPNETKPKRGKSNRRLKCFCIKRRHVVHQSTHNTKLRTCLHAIVRFAFERWRNEPHRSACVLISSRQVGRCCLWKSFSDIGETEKARKKKTKTLRNYDSTRSKIEIHCHEKLAAFC